MASIFEDLASEIIAELGHEFEQKLILTIKHWRFLYARDDPDYYNMQQNKLGWIKIAHLLKKPVAECMGKWYYVLDLYFNGKKDDQTWPHHKSLQEMEPHLTQTYSEMQNKTVNLSPKPTSAQRHIFMSELLANRSQLFAKDTGIEQRREIWKSIADKVNDVPNGVNMPVLKWQKYWWDQKQSFGVQSSQIRTKLQLMGTKLDVSKYSAEDLMILKFCGVSVKENPSIISAVLSSNVEFGSDGHAIPQRCKKCAVILSEQIPYEYCETCRKMPPTLCDICSKRHEPKLTVHKVKNWTPIAKNLLPTAFHSFAEIRACTVCSLNLEKISSQIWKTCRVCENYNQTLENLFLPTNDNLRKIFKEATNAPFSEYDGLPAFICKACKIQMQQFNNFFLRFHRTQTRLKKVHEEQFIGMTVARPSAKAKLKLNNSPQVSANNVMIIKPGQGMVQSQQSNEKGVPHMGNGNAPTIKSTPVRVMKINCSAQPVHPGEGNGPTQNQVKPFFPKEITMRPLSANATPHTPPPGSTTVVPQDSPNSTLKTYLLSRPKAVQQIISKLPANTEVALSRSTHSPALSTPPPRGIPQFSPKSGISMTKKIVYSVSVAASQPQPKVTYTFSSPSIGATTSTSARKIIPCSSLISKSPQNGHSPIAKKLPPTGASKILIKPVNSCQNQFVNTITKPAPMVSAVKPTPINYQNFDDDGSLPAYCIPKSLTVSRKLQSPSQVSRTVPNAVQKESPVVPAPKIIKIENMDSAYPDSGPMQTNNIDKSPSSTSTTLSVESVECNQKDKSFHDDNRKTSMPPKSQVATVPPCKKVRKNWGFVDEFQISSLPNKATPFDGKRIQQRRMTIHNTSVARVNTPPVARSRTPEQSRLFDDIEIKDEPIDKDPGLSANNKPSGKETNHSMFYPDSFELKQLSLSVDVSSMLNDMLTKQRVLSNSLSMDDDSLDYLNPSFPEQKKGNPAPASTTPSQVSSDHEDSNPKKITAPTLAFPIKKLRIKLKRFGRPTVRINNNSSKIARPTTTRKSRRQTKSRR